MLKLGLALLAVTAPSVALAQAAQCSPPGQIARPEPELPSEQEPRRALPVGGYTLALSWSPQYCSTVRGAKSAFQCSGRRGKFAFTLHGLWPDGVGKEWPQYCRATDSVPLDIIRQNMCVTPSPQLIQHEWAKHGTCMTTRPELYFNLSRAFYQSIRYPDMAALAQRKTLTVGQFTQAFARANRGFRADMMRVTTVRGNWLSEVWLCMDRQLEHTKCPVRQGEAPDGSYLRIEPGPRIVSRSLRRPVKPSVGPIRSPALRLDLDPNIQPLTNSAGQ